jgi:pyridinium-3,5-biscarboxylic acid mononucleotide synthase
MGDAPPAQVSGGSGYADLGFARVDTDRESRQGLPEAVYGPGKQVPEIVGIVQRLLNHNHGPVLVTRVEPATAAQVSAAVPGARYVPQARLLVWRPAPSIRFRVAVVTAGTADAPVAHEAAAVSTATGLEVALIRDVGVAGIHRLLAVAPELHTYHAVIVVAGMEAALASVVGGLVASPVIAVPTSIGYGASFEGVTALLGMLTSCAAGLTVVNIDSGYGAAMAAYRMAYATRQARTENDDRSRSGASWK